MPGYIILIQLMLHFIVYLICINLTIHTNVKRQLLYQFFICNRFAYLLANIVILSVIVDYNNEKVKEHGTFV